MTDDTTPDAASPTRLRKAIELGWQEVDRLAANKMQGRWSIPADQARDTDLIFGEVLQVASNAADQIEALASLLRRTEDEKHALENEVARLTVRAVAAEKERDEWKRQAQLNEESWRGENLIRVAAEKRATEAEAARDLIAQSVQPELEAKHTAESEVARLQRIVERVETLAHNMGHDKHTALWKNRLDAILAAPEHPDVGHNVDRAE